MSTATVNKLPLHIVADMIARDFSDDAPVSELSVLLADLDSAHLRRFDAEREFYRAIRHLVDIENKIALARSSEKARRD